MDSTNTITIKKAIKRHLCNWCGQSTTSSAHRWFEGMAANALPVHRHAEIMKTTETFRPDFVDSCEVEIYRRRLDERLRNERHLVNLIRSQLPEMTACERVEMFDLITEGYCTMCGEREISGPCQCRNDE